MTKTKTARRHQKKAEGEGVSLFFSSLKSYALTLCSSSLLLLLFSYIAYKTRDPAAFVDMAAYLCLGLSSLLGGVLSAAGARDDALLASLCSGGMYVMTLLLMALATDNINSPLYMLLGYAASVLLFVIGAFIFTKLTQRRRGRRRR